MVELFDSLPGEVKSAEWRNVVPLQGMMYVPAIWAMDVVAAFPDASVLPLLSLPPPPHALNAVATTVRLNVERMRFFI